MPSITTTGINHIRLTVTDIKRSRAFYTEVLGFEVAMEPQAGDDPATQAVNAMLFGGVIFQTNGMLFGLRPVASGGDHFNEDRVGLDHLSFGVGGRDDLDAAARLLDERGVPHGDIKDLGPDAKMYILEFRDPDNIQLELSAPYSR
jgi:glyoxylase I family protein